MPKEPKPLEPLKLNPLIPLGDLKEVVRRMIGAPKPGAIKPPAKPKHP